MGNQWSADEDGDPCRGLLIGLAISAVVWLFLAAVVWLW